MYRGEQQPPKHVNLVFDDGGLGDSICRVVPVKYLHQRHQHVTIDVWVGEYFKPLGQHLLQDCERVTVRSFNEASPKTAINGSAARQVRSIDHTNLATHLLDHAFHLLADTSPEIQDKNYLKLRLDQINIEHLQLPANYAVITADYTAKVRELPASTVNGLIHYFLANGIEPVLLGKSLSKVNAVFKIIGNFSDEIDIQNVLDLRDKTTLLEAGKVMAGAKVVCGLDNGLIHLAGCTDVPIIAAYTTVDPRHRLPYRNDELGWNCHIIRPNESLACRGCQSNMQFEWGHDFRECFYKDYLCTKQITTKKFTRILDEYFISRS